MGIQSHRTVCFEVVDRIVWITLNRRGSLNAVDARMAGELHRAWSRVATMSSTDAVVLIGAGVESFSLGIDRSPGAVPALADSLVPPRLDVPLVIAVNGMACAEALDLVRAADTVVAARHARFFALRPPSPLDSDAAAMRAAEAHTAGLVDTVVPVVWLRTEAEKAARRLAAGGIPTGRARRSKPDLDTAWRRLTGTVTRRP
jgi:enoyl-CoA hydratase/carnithine racemase